mgnify:FL=1
MLYLSLDKWFYQCIYTILKRMYIYGSTNAHLWIYECTSMDLRMYIYGSTNAQLLMNKYYTIEITEQYHCVEQKTADI